MALEDLADGPEHELASPTTLYRVQRNSASSATVVIGPLKLPPRGLLTNRFDHAHLDVGYFAGADVTAVYETLARREAITVSLSGEIALRELLTLQTTRPLKLLDLRGHAYNWPVLQATRFVPTQGLAAAARSAGYEGIVYRSAQQYGADCFAVFGTGALSSLSLVTSTPLALATTSGGHRMHRVMALAIQRSLVTLTP